MLVGAAALAGSPAGGPAAAALATALLGLGLWLSRGPAPTWSTGNGGTMSANQALLLLLALGGAAVLVGAGATSRPMHGLAVAPFAMAAFALSSYNSRDLRSGVLAAAAGLLVLSAADDRAIVMTLCVAGLLPLVFGWINVRQLMVLDRYPEAAVALLAPRSRPWSAAVVVRLLVLTAVVALLVPAEPPPRLHPGQGFGAGQRVPSTGARGDAIGGADGSLDLRQRGTLDSRSVLMVDENTPELWQGGYVDDYQGSGWTRTGSAAPQTQRFWDLPLRTGLPTGAGITASRVIRAGGTGSAASALPPLIYSPGPIVGVDAEAGRLFDFGTGSLALFDHTDPTAAYTVAWRAPDTTVNGTVTAFRPAVADPRWLQLPAELPQRVRDLARTVTASATTTSAKVIAIEKYLGANEKYKLDSPVPAVGRDAVDAFLFVDHVGFCEQFASAETVMLRSLGIPARVATGFGGRGVSGGGWRIYRNQDAHAWVQVGYPGERWVNSDPTAGSQLAASSGTHALAPWLRKLWKQLTGTADARRTTAAALFLVAVTGWLIALVLRRRRNREIKTEQAAALTSPAGLAYGRLLERLVEQERPRRPTETIRDLLLRLGAPDPEQVAAVLEAEWYGVSGSASAQSSARAAAALDGLALEAPVMVGSAP